MPEQPAEVPNHPFDLEILKDLVALMEQHGLAEVDLKRGEQQWRIRRGPVEGMQVVSAGYPFAGMPAAAPAKAETSPAPEDPGTMIRSPTVGTFYSASAPGEEAYVGVGARVSKDTVVCIIEAMKVMNHITADVDGTITQILVRNGDAVEFNQPLFRVKLG